MHDVWPALFVADESRAEEALEALRAGTVIAPLASGGHVRRGASFLLVLENGRVLGSGETTAEAALKSMGDNALDIITAWHYDYMSKNPLNVKFVKEYQSVAGGRNPDFFSIGGYDGMHAIYEALKKTNGKTDAEALVAAAKGMKWESPRGPMMIDPETRDVVQNVYIRRVEKVDGELVNVPFATIPMVKDPAGERRKTGQK